MQLTIDSTSTPANWGLLDTAPSLEIYADQQFDTHDGLTVLPGNVNLGDFRHRVVGSVTAGVATFPAVTGIYSTEDSVNNQVATYSAYIRVNGSEPIPWLLNFPIPPLPTGQASWSWSRLRTMRRVVARRSNEVYTKTGTDGAIAAALAALDLDDVDVSDASTTVKGITKLSVAPVSASNPIAVGDNDPRLVSAGAAYLNVLDFDAAADAVVIEDATISLGTPTTLSSVAGGLTSAIIGKVISIAGAGVAGATLITTVTAVPTATTLTLAAAASTAVTNSRAVYGTDNTAAFQDALDAAALSLVTNTVFVPRGNYLFATGSLTVPQGVSLQGEWETAGYHLGYRYSNEPKPMVAKGTTFVVTTGEGSATGRFILLNSLAVLRGVVMFYPSELATLATPKLYPWAVEMFGAGCVVEDVELVNPYQGIFSHIGQRQRVRNVVGLPLNIGLYASQQLGTSYYEDIDFGPVYTYGVPEGGAIGPLMSWIHTNGTAFKIGRVDNAQFINCGHFAYSRGFKFVVDAAESTTFAGGTGAPGGSAWAQFVNCLSDTAPFGVEIDQVQGADSTGAAGITFVGCEFTASQIFAVSGSTLIGLHIKSTNTGRIGVSNCRFHLAGKNIVHEGGRLNVTGCFFQTWTTKAIEILAGVVTITGSLFKSGSALTVITVAGSWTTVTGNTFEYVDGCVTSSGANFNESGNAYADTSLIWTAPTMQNSWASIGGGFETAAYKKIDGWVFLKGTIGGGAIGNVAFTLPSGFRPPLNVIFGTSSNGVFGSLVIESGGLVRPNVGSGVSFSLDGVLFPIR